MKCPLCGEQVAQDDLFCGNCGYNLLQDRKEEAPKEDVTSAEAAPAAEAAGSPEVKSETPAFALPTTTVRAAGPTTPAPKGKTSTWLIVLVVAILLFLCCCCGSVALYFMSQPTTY